MQDKKQSLQEIIEDYRSLDEIMVEQGGELTDEQQELIVEQWMTELKNNLSLKADAYCYRIESLENAEEMLDLRAKKITAAKKTIGRLRDSLKDKMKYAMLDLGISKIEGVENKVSLSKSRPSVEIENEADLPPEFVKIKTITSPDKDAIKEAIQSGQTVPGAYLVTGTTMRISKNTGLVRSSQQ